MMVLNYSMGKLKLTGQSLGQVEDAIMIAMQFLPIRPNLELKTRPKRFSPVRYRAPRL
jgi:hypothetical protein